MEPGIDAAMKTGRTYCLLYTSGKDIVAEKNQR